MICTERERKGKRVGVCKAGIAALLLLATLVAAADPYIGYIFPASARRGAPAELLLGGQELRANAERCSGFFTGGGITVTSVEFIPNFPNPTDGKQMKWLMDWLKDPAHRPEKPVDASTNWIACPFWEKIDQLDTLERELIRKFLVSQGQDRRTSPAISEMAIVKIDVAYNALLGMREFRLAGVRGVSNPRPFFVDDCPHVSDLFFALPSWTNPMPVTALAPPCTLDGRILKLETDRFTLPLKADKTYSFTMHARVLQPFIGDAVPGYFQGTLRLRDDQGREAAFADEVYFQPDPVLEFTPKASGIYTLEVADNLLRGREDFVYSVTIAEGKIPYLQERNPFHNPAADEQVFSGCLQKKGAVNEHSFSGKKGEDCVIRVAARQLGSPLDAVIRLFGPDGKQLGEADDSAPLFNIGLVMQHFDPELRLTLPADGKYKLEIFDRQHFGGKDYRYWIKAGKPHPDFEVYTFRSVANVPGKGGWKSVKAYLDRKDGFDGEVAFTGQDNMICIQGKIEKGKTEGQIVFQNNQLPKAALPGSIKIFAKAVVDGKPVVKEVNPTDEWDQAFAWKHLVPAKEFIVGTLRPNAPAAKKQQPAQKKK